VTSEARARRQAKRRALIACALVCAGVTVHADAVDTLRQFARDVNSGRASFAQTVTSPDGVKKKSSAGRFEFARPDRFRFVYLKPFEQQIVADGQKVWLYDVDLNQVTVRAMTQALGATPAALLAGSNLDQDFELSALPARDGLEWAQARPRVKEGATFATLRVGFKGKTLDTLEIDDAFGQRSTLRFADFASNLKLADDAFRFTPPKGVDVIEQ
jgi:outer membrane lipoprotein carrier protein